MTTFSIPRTAARVLGALLIVVAAASGTVAVLELVAQQHDTSSSYCVKSEPAPPGASKTVAPVGDFRLIPLGIACTWQTSNNKSFTTYPQLAPSGFAAITVLSIIGVIVAFRYKGPYKRRR